MNSWSQWSSCDDAVFSGPSPRVMLEVNDTLVVGGAFGDVNNEGYNGIAKWNGQSWSDFPSAGGVEDIVQYGDSLIFSGGFNEQVDCEECNTIGAFYNGEWRDLGGGANSPAASVSGLAVLNGQLIAVGSFSEIGGVEPLQRVAMWDGTNWNNIGGISGFIGVVMKAALYNDAVYVGGDFALADGTVPSPNLAHWNGTEWIEVETGPSGTVLEIFPYPDHGYMYVGGLFSSAGGEFSPGIAKFDGVNTTPIGPVGFNDSSNAICVYRDQIYAAGNFTQLSDGTEMSHISRFDGVHWQPLEGGIGGNVFDLAVYQDQLYAVGAIAWAGSEEFEIDGIARWFMHPDSVTWGVPDHIDGLVSKEELHIHPNPTQSSFTVVDPLEEEALFVLIDHRGRELTRHKAPARKELLVDVSNYQTGVYYVHFVIKGEIRASGRVVKTSW